MYFEHSNYNVYFMYFARTQCQFLSIFAKLGLSGRELASFLSESRNNFFFLHQKKKLEVGFEPREARANQLFTLMPYPLGQAARYENLSDV